MISSNHSHNPNYWAFPSHNKNVFEFGKVDQVEASLAECFCLKFPGPQKCLIEEQAAGVR